MCSPSLAGVLKDGEKLSFVRQEKADKPEQAEVKIGFIPLTDCASVVMASVLGFDKKYGIKIVLSKESSWASVRDKLVNGELDASHVLYGLIYGVHLGVSGPKKDMAVLMTLTLASMQFSPRIIVSFARDRVTQGTLGIFLGTFSYCVAALPAARSAPGPKFAPSSERSVSQ